MGKHKGEQKGEHEMERLPTRRALAILCLLTVAALLASGCGLPDSAYNTEKAPVLKVYSTSDGPHRFIAYVVDRRGAEVVVSDPLARSNHKVGDTITYREQKMSVGEGTRVLSFTLVDIP
jgi:hypothetical protein